MEVDPFEEWIRLPAISTPVKLRPNSTPMPQLSASVSFPEISRRPAGLGGGKGMFTPPGTAGSRASMHSAGSVSYGMLPQPDSSGRPGTSQSRPGSRLASHRSRMSSRGSSRPGSRRPDTRQRQKRWYRREGGDILDLPPSLEGFVPEEDAFFKSKMDDNFKKRLRGLQMLLDKYERCGGDVSPPTNSPTKKVKSPTKKSNMSKADVQMMSELGRKELQEQIEEERDALVELFFEGHLPFEYAQGLQKLQHVLQLSLEEKDAADKEIDDHILSQKKKMPLRFLFLQTGDTEFCQTWAIETLLTYLHQVITHCFPHKIFLRPS